MGIQTQKYINVTHGRPRKRHNCHLKIPGPTSFFCFNRILRKGSLNDYLIFTEAGKETMYKTLYSCYFSLISTNIQKQNKKKVQTAKWVKCPVVFLSRFYWFMINITLSLIPDMMLWGASDGTNDKTCRIIWADVQSLKMVTWPPQGAVHY